MNSIERATTDLRNAVRAMRRNVVLSAIMILTLALGLGANTTIFSLVKSVLFIEADFGEHTGRVISLHSLHPSRAQQLDDARLSWPEFETLRGSLKGVERVEGYIWRDFTLSAEEGAVRARGVSVTPGLFELIDARPALGRLFVPEDAQAPGFERSVIISTALWQRQYGGDPTIIGRPITINGRSLDVIGVMPEGFGFPERQDLWLAYKPATTPLPTNRSMNGLALLTKGETEKALIARLEPMSLELERRLPESQRDFGLTAAHFPNSMIGGTPAAMTALLLAVTMVLLIVCANLAGLLVARAVERRREVALKSALGASRGSLVRELLAEVFVISLTGAALGWAFSAWAVPRLVASFPEPPPYWMRFDVDGTAFAYCLGLTLLTTLCAGLLPALRSASADPGNDLRDAGRSVTSSPRTRVVQEGIVVTQVAVCLALVVGAQLMIQSFNNLLKADSGVREEGLLTLRLYLSGDSVDAPSARAQALARLEEGIRSRPGVLLAAVTTAIPADDGGAIAMLVRDVATPPASEIPATVVGGSEELFDAMGNGLLRGRPFTSTEVQDEDATAVIVSASLAKALGGSADVVGSTIALRTGTSHGWRTIVGVAPDVQYEEFGEETRAGRQALYVPYARLGGRQVEMMVRTSGPAEPLVRELKQIARQAHPGLVIFDARTMAQVRESTTWDQRLFARLMGLFAAAAMVLAGMGLYGLLRQFVGARTHEIGVRRALGASGQSIARLVVSRAGFVTGIGVAVGALLSTIVARGLAGLLFETSGTNTDTWVAAAVSIVALVLACCAVPVARAVRVDPIVTLRQE